MSSAKVIRLWGAVDFKPDIRFLDRLNKTAHEFHSEFPHWITDRVTAQLSDYDNRHELLHISSKRIAFEAINPEDQVASLTKLCKLLKRALRTLECSTIKRMGLKMSVFDDVGLTFEELRSQIRPLCLPESSPLEQFTSSEIVDIALNFDYKWNNKTVLFRAGPMKKLQGRENLLNVGQVSRLFPPQAESDSLSELCSKIPEAFLFFDLDVFCEEETIIENWSAFSDEVIPHIMDVYRKFRSMILETP